MAELRSAIFWVLNCPIYLLRCYIFATTIQTALQEAALSLELSTSINWLTSEYLGKMWIVPPNMI
ncbi:MAG: hypothetical protein IM583_19145 [Pseudanabaena sp. M114S2SP2A07QC]|nr:hypothetical protein [Pseudanabaena sp. M125S2SP2A07QC]MCA6541345.1 hypothetical protein [Pseudanabaena sp. M037S2SP2A07QC]MCA6546326.1 hypothetical protein [Pseudanabaena sp. M152S2SP2A07QC]MCA6558675.1 hypothetical protein [Pseudanabaena sp. M114S2SP2A07QC]MCA6567148.1 hypothetical protein [Pseudanabaena sp. M151S2SP2A07QC]MCA6569803.1 hypothetical protein [Pseudanabaena sp. M065S1SP2A07QC]MCA6579688.1 hypothetical protein [Pseudanabaena sp. M085S1SP2A07QC]